MKVKDKKEVSILDSIIIVLIILILMVGFTYKISIDYRKTDEKLNSMTTREYTISNGETLYGISLKYLPSGISIYDYMDKIKEINNKDTSEIYANETINILVEE